MNRNKHMIGEQIIIYNKTIIYLIYSFLKYLNYMTFYLKEKGSYKKLKIYTYMENKSKK